MKKEARKIKNQSQHQSQIEALTEKFVAGKISTEQYVKDLKASNDGDYQRRQIEKRIEDRVCCY